ncbi:hypothetical protein PROFUN_11056 [Planoprotostelium fungivorum]|uniref:Uncharacterized protein n=1 Tax=Planoprotostelium fungivorum TaxID=1890364 RepID=A0A2P6NBM8_9EUKA|nr:hypothetical protein PROFUN_11056 [Planoprotostelium fungivorum]
MTFLESNKSSSIEVEEGRGGDDEPTPAAELRYPIEGERQQAVYGLPQLNGKVFELIDDKIEMNNGTMLRVSLH